MASRARRTVLLIGGLVAAATATDAVADRLDRLRAAVARVEPDATFNQGGVQIQGKPVAFPAFTQMRNGTPEFLMTAVQYPDDIAKLLSELLAFKNPTLVVRPTKFLVARVNEDTVEDAVAVVLDPSALAVECRHATLAPGDDSEIWPVVRVSCRSWFRTVEWVGYVDWIGEVRADEKRLISKVPTGFQKQRVGQQPKRDLLVVQRVGPGRISVATPQGTAVEYDCGTPCIADLNAVLAAL